MGSTPLDLWTPFQIDSSALSVNFSLPSTSLPKQYIDGTIRTGNGVRCTIQYGALESRGGYGTIYRGKRLGPAVTDICVKVPHNIAFSLCPEAIMQWMASNTLIGAGIIGAIPEVYDIFQYAGETRFSMRYIKGVSSIEFILNSDDPEKALFSILAQVSLLLAYLEETIHLDHRDLKADNIWIRQIPISYSVKIRGVSWSISAPFQVVVLDFGFSCIGSKEGMAVVSLSDGILPKLDPCPKDGRDLFQLIASIWSISIVREVMSTAVHADIEHLLSYKNQPYASLTSQTSQSWIYLLVSDSSFRHPPLHPLSLLRILSIKYPHLHIDSE